MSTRKCDWCGKNIYDGEGYYHGGLTRIYCSKRCQVKGENQHQLEVDERNREINEAGGLWPWIKMKTIKVLPTIGLLLLVLLVSWCSQ